MVTLGYSSEMANRARDHQRVQIISVPLIEAVAEWKVMFHLDKLNP